MLIFLWGMPGSGKSTFGRQIAIEHSLPFFDLDAYIEARENLQIADIFARGGEPLFREKERDALQALTEATASKGIIATGGGTPCFFDNAALMKKQGFTLWIDTPLLRIAERLGSDTQNIRPMFEGLSREAALQKLENLYVQRQPFYAQAHLRWKPSQA